MEPIDERITAAQLLSLRGGANPAESIATLLGVEAMPPRLAARTLVDIGTFVATGDAIAASQLIHAAIVRRRRGAPPKPARSRRVE